MWSTDCHNEAASARRAIMICLGRSLAQELTCMRSMPKKGNRTTVKCVDIGGMEHRYTVIYVFLIKILKVKLIQWLQAHLAEISSSNSGFIDWLLGAQKTRANYTVVRLLFFIIIGTLALTAATK